MLTIFQNELVVKLSDNNENAADTDSRILDAYINQCTAEAQEGMETMKESHNSFPGSLVYW